MPVEASAAHCEHVTMELHMLGDEAHRLVDIVGPKLIEARGELVTGISAQLNLHRNRNPLVALVCESAYSSNATLRLWLISLSLSDRSSSP